MLPESVAFTTILKYPGSVGVPVNWAVVEDVVVKLSPGILPPTQPGKQVVIAQVYGAVPPCAVKTCVPYGCPVVPLGNEVGVIVICGLIVIDNPAVTQCGTLSQS